MAVHATRFIALIAAARAYETYAEALRDLVKEYTNPRKYPDPYEALALLSQMIQMLPPIQSEHIRTITREDEHFVRNHKRNKKERERIAHKRIMGTIDTNRARAGLPPAFDPDPMKYAGYAAPAPLPPEPPAEDWDSYKNRTSAAAQATDGEAECVAALASAAKRFGPALYAIPSAEDLFPAAEPSPPLPPKGGSDPTTT